jgi:hypothetical protein
MLKGELNGVDYAAVSYQNKVNAYKKNDIVRFITTFLIFHVECIRFTKNKRKTRVKFKTKSR